MLKASKISLVIMLSLLTASCLNGGRFSSLEKRGTPQWAATAPAKPVSKPSSSKPGFYLVKPGDTLYSIAFRFGLDYRKLAAANGIGSDFRIFAGQSLRLSEKSTAVSTPVVHNTKSEAEPIKAESRPVVKNNSQNNVTLNSVGQNDNDAVVSWVWPHGGKIVRAYMPDSSDRKGIDISGRIGDSVLAAAGGTVVYAGDGLPGYGNLIIVEHQNSFLSAYAFAESILVEEKDRVRTGQKIATMGKQGDQPGLHFEIRKNGKPVNPARYLPKR